MGLPLGFVAPRENALYDEDVDNVALKVPRKKAAKDDNKNKKKKKAGKTLNFKTDKVWYTMRGDRSLDSFTHAGLIIFRSRGTPTRRGR